MRIGAVRSFVIGYSDPNDFMSRRMTVLVRVETTDGIVGWGEGIAMWQEACWATKLLVDGTYGPMLIEAGETTVRSAWDMFRAHTWWYGEGGIAGFAYSALDMALWDVEGKAQNRPLYELFGGLKHRDLPAYACNHVNKATLEENVAEVVGFKEQGYRGCKLGFAKKGLSNIGRDPDGDVEFVARLRAAVGDNFDIVVDAGNGVKWDRETAIRTVRRMAEFSIGWIEEPFYPSQIDDYRALKAAVNVPIGTGEREWTVSGYGRLIETGTVDIVGVDPARAEGMTGFRLVDEICGAYRRHDQCACVEHGDPCRGEPAAVAGVPQRAAHRAQATPERRAGRPGGDAGFSARRPGGAADRPRTRHRRQRGGRSPALGLAAASQLDC